MTLLNPRELRLRDEYVSGRIEIDEFEWRLEYILRGKPFGRDREPVLPRWGAMTDEPGAIHYYTPIKGQRPPQWIGPPIRPGRKPLNLTD